MKTASKSCFLLGLGMLTLGAALGFATGAYLAGQQNSSEDLAICKMGRETRQQALDTATQELNQCQQQLKRMR